LGEKQLKKGWRDHLAGRDPRLENVLTMKSSKELREKKHPTGEPGAGKMVPF